MCLFVLEVDNLLLDELVVFRNRIVEEWNRVINKFRIEIKLLVFWKGKFYEDEKIIDRFYFCFVNGCEECRGICNILK